MPRKQLDSQHSCSAVILEHALLEGTRHAHAAGRRAKARSELIRQVRLRRETRRRGYIGERRI
jgi:hypothetical protein